MGLVEDAGSDLRNWQWAKGHHFGAAVVVDPALRFRGRFPAVVSGVERRVALDLNVHHNRAARRSGRIRLPSSVPLDPQCFRGTRKLSKIGDHGSAQFVGVLIAHHDGLTLEDLTG